MNQARGVAALARQSGQDGIKPPETAILGVANRFLVGELQGVQNSNGMDSTVARFSLGMKWMYCQVVVR